MLGLELGIELGDVLGISLGDELGCVVPVAESAVTPSAMRLNSDTKGSVYQGCRMSLGSVC